MNIQIHVNSASLEKAFRAAPTKTVKAINLWISKTSALVEREEKKQVPVLTGMLQNSVHQVISGVQAEIKPNINYAVFVHEGARGHKPNKFADRTYQAIKPAAERDAKQMIDDILRSI